MAMDTELQKHVDRQMKVAHLRGLGPRNPIVLSEVVESSVFKTVVSIEEPSHHSIPSNVIWVCMNPAFDGTGTPPKPDMYQKIFVRTDDATPEEAYIGVLNGTWKAIELMADLYASQQFYDLNGVFLLGEMLVGTPIPDATTDVLGKVRLNKAFGALSWLYDAASPGSNIGLDLNGDSVPLQTLLGDTTNKTHQQAVNTFTVNSGSYYTWCAILKADTLSKAALYFSTLGGAWTAEYAIFDLSNGTLVSKTANITNNSIKSLPNDWYLVSATMRAVASVTAKARCAILLVKTTTTSFRGDGTESIFVWDAALVAGRHPTMPVKTSHNTVIETTDERMYDARVPLAHTHPAQPAEELEAYNGATVVLRNSPDPAAGNVLVIDENGDAIWRGLVNADIAPLAYRLTGLAVTGPTSVNETDVGVTFGAVATYTYQSPNTPQTFQEAAAATWTVAAADGSSRANKGSRNATTGALTLNASNITADTNIVVTATYTYESVTLTKPYNVTVRNIVVLSNVAVSGPLTVSERTSRNFTCTAYYDNGTNANVSSTCVWTLVNVPPGSTVTISPTGVLTATNLAGDCLVGVKATYTHDTVSVSHTLNITLVEVPLVLRSVTVSGALTVYDGKTYNYTALATYEDGSTKDITTLASWSLSNGLHATVTPTSGVLTVGALTADYTDRVNATYTDNGTTQTGFVNLSLLDNYVTSISVSGPSTVNEGATATFSANLNYRDTSVVSGTGLVTWSATIGTFSGNTYTAPGVTANTGATVSASFTNVTGPAVAPGQKSITVTNVPLVLYPKYGVYTCGVKDGATMQSVLTSQLGTVNSGNDVTFNIPSGSYGYFALPDTIGTKVKFVNKSTNFEGGWDGAQWNCPAGIESLTLTDAIPVTLTTNGELHTWYLYRTDADGLGTVTYYITYQ